MFGKTSVNTISVSLFQEKPFFVDKLQLIGVHNTLINYNDNGYCNFNTEFFFFQKERTQLFVLYIYPCE